MDAAVQLYQRAALRPATADKGSRTVEVVFSTGAEVVRQDWRTGESFLERLSMEPSHIRLKRLQHGAPVLDTHRAQGTASVIGVVESARVERGEGIALLRFSERDEVQPIWKDLVGGVLRNVSIGYVVHRWKVSRATKGRPEVRTAIDWEPFEISVVPIPADADARTRAAELGREVSMENEEQQPNEDRSAVAQERQRVAAIDELCRTHRVAPDQRSTWIREGADLTDVREAILAQIERRSRENHITTIHAGDGYRERSLQRDAADALARRAGVDVEGEGHRHFGDARLLDVASRVLEAGGVNARTLNGAQIAERALSTSDFASILMVAGQKIVRNAYDAVPLAHREVLRRTTANDFRAKHSVSNASASVLPEVPEGGEYPFHSVSAEQATYALKTYGSRIGITRQMVVNDDFGMLESAGRQRGRSAAETERKVVWDFILGNPTAPDGNQMFDEANHGNYPAVSASPIGPDALAAARLALRMMKSPDGFEVNGILRHVVVAPGGETDFDQLINGLWVPTGSGSAMTPSLRAVKLHVEPLISADKKHWFGFTDVSQCDHFEFAYLSGSEGPQIAQRTKFENDQLELKVVLDFGVGAIDHRGVYYQRET